FCAARASLRGKTFAALELPGAGDVQDVDLLDEILGERRVRRRHFDDADRGVVQHGLAGGTPDGDLVDGTVGVQSDIEDEAAGKFFAACLIRIIEITHAFDL